MLEKLISLSNISLVNLCVFLMFACGICLSIVYIVVQNNKELSKQNEEILKNIDSKLSQILNEFNTLKTEVNILLSILPKTRFNYKRGIYDEE